ncbi:MAG: glutamine synthetase family protein [Bacteroidales bacterium]|nr:glutamine synthetase family protein [Bacteroidales bacterium]
MNINMNPNPLVRFLGKPACEFTKEDIVRYIREEGIQMVNFRYPGADGRLKTLNFIINDETYLESILTYGERVDGSSLFPYIEAGASDLYVIPRYRTAFRNPFSEIPAVDILCSYYTKDGTPLDMSPEYTLRKAHRELERVTGCSYHVMGELEYYVVTPRQDLFMAADQRGYHESTPFNKGAEFRAMAMKYIAESGGMIKYGHSEVGNFVSGELQYEQNEIEFLPVSLEDAADQLMVAKWIIRTLGYRYGVDVTFAPKITVGKAGNGLHIHTRLMRNGRNAMINDNGSLSDDAKRVIAGYLYLAPSLTAFGNTNPTSYFRLVPHQEAPTNICWGDRNRSVLVRVPLGWSAGAGRMASDANPLEKEIVPDVNLKQTVEFRCPDGSADIYLLLAGLAVAARHGFEMENGLQYAADRYVDVNIFDEKNREVLGRLSQLPASCAESAECLRAHRGLYEQYGVFSPRLIDGIIARLAAFDDANLRNEIGNDQDRILRLVKEYFYCG